MIARGARPAGDVEGAAQQRLVVGAMGCGGHDGGSADCPKGLARKSWTPLDELTPQIIAASSFDTSAAPATVAQNCGVRSKHAGGIARLLTPPRPDGAGGRGAVFASHRVERGLI